MPLDASLVDREVTVRLQGPIPFPPLVLDVRPDGLFGSAPNPLGGEPLELRATRELDSRQPMSAEARSYLEEALDLMEENSINRSEINWPALREASFARAAGAQTRRATYGAIWFAVSELGDNHSQFLPGWYQGARAGGPVETLVNPDPIVRPLTESIGYVWVPGYTFDDISSMSAKAEMYHRRIAEVDSEETCGWVVDLRGNTGGSMTPMLIGIGPVLGQGPTGAFSGGDTTFQHGTYERGELLSDGLPRSQQYRVQVQQPYELISPNPPVAVLTDQVTGSSGEAVVVAFIGRPNTRSFGTRTAGLSTGNAMHRLSDDAALNITEGAMVDRTGRVYGGEIEPDSIIEGQQTRDPETDAPLRAAVEWLQDHPKCRP